MFLDGHHYEAIVTPCLEEGAIIYQVVLFRDINSHVSLEEELVRKNRHLVVSNALAGTFINSDDMSGIYEDLVLKAMAITEMPIGMIVTIESGKISIESTKGFSVPLRAAADSGKMDEFIRKLFLSETPMEIIENMEDGMPAEMWDDGIRFCVSIPLRSHGENLGILMLGSRLSVSLDFDLASLLSITGNIMSLLSDKIRLFKKARMLSITDSLTGLYNIRHFYEELDREIERSHRYDEQFSVILCDIDNFKAVNDDFGHQAGDEVLRSVSDILTSNARVTDTVARYGGEEFILILPETSKDKAAALAERIRIAVSSCTMLREEGGIRVSLSCGVASYPVDSQSSKGILYCSDMAMYKAKGLGKNMVVCFDAEGYD